MRVLVIGGGAIGMMQARSLAQQGCQVVLLEKCLWYCYIEKYVKESVLQITKFYLCSQNTELVDLHIEKSKLFLSMNIFKYDYMGYIINIFC